MTISQLISCLELSIQEIETLVSQTVIPSRGQLGGAVPMAFTEEGVAMLSSVLRSPRAVQVNITIMRAFVRLREMLLSNADLARNLIALENKYDGQFKVIFEDFAELQDQCTNGKPKYGAICDRYEMSDNLRQHCIPDQIFNSLADDYDSFLVERRKLMAAKMKEYFAKL